MNYVAFIICIIYAIKLLAIKHQRIHNSERSFENSLTIETGLSGFHRLVVTALQLYLPNNQPKIISYRNYKHFDNKRFLKDFQLELEKLGSLSENIKDVSKCIG